MDEMIKGVATEMGCGEYHVGFSGSRYGMSDHQIVRTTNVLYAIKQHFGNRTLWFHHGDCIGADDQAQAQARPLGYKIYKHPSLDTKFSVNSICNKEDPPYSYQGRNQRIVLASQLMITTPYSKSGGGGTWHTIGYARANKKPLIIAYRDGSYDTAWLNEELREVVHQS